MPRQRRGAIFIQKGKIIARVRWKSSAGKTKEIERVARDQAEAEILLKEILTLSEQETPSKKATALPSLPPPPLAATSGSEENGYHRSFNELADAYEAENLQPALIVDGHKVDGLKSLNNAKRNMLRMREAYGGMWLKSISYGHIKAYKLKMHSEKKADGKRKYRISSVNRELEFQRGVFRWAELRDWIKKSPFKQGAPLINKDAENKRERILSYEEEPLLLAACEGEERRKHLRPIIICAIGTGARRKELMGMKWEHVNFETDVIRIIAANSKTEKARKVPITPRMRTELLAWKEERAKVGGDKPESRVFGVVDNVKRSFATVRKLAGLKDFRFHDLRHTAITRMILAGMSSELVMQISGHTQHTTFQRYLNGPDDEIAEVGRRTEERDEMMRAKLFRSQQKK